MIRLNYIGIQQKTTYTKWQHAVMVVLAVFLFSAYSIRLQAQTLTIVSSGETGTLGTNWSISGNTLTVSGTASITASVITDHLTSTGSLEIVGNTNLFGVTVSETISVPSGSNGLTLGSSGNTGSVTVGSPIGVAGPLTVIGGAVVLNANLATTNATLGNINITTSGLSGTGNITLADNRSFTITQSGESNYSGIITGTGVGLTKNGNGSLGLLGANMYTGGTFINTGRLFGGPGSLVRTAFGSGDITIEADATLLTDRSTLSNNLILNGGILAGNNGFGEVWSGNVTISATSTVELTYSFTSITFTGAVSGSGNLAKTGLGQLTFAGANTSTGTVTISDGKLQVGAGSTTGELGSGAVINNGSVVFNRSNDLTLGNIISGTGALTKNGNGTLTLTNNQTYQGSTVINAGTLVLSNDNPATGSSGFSGTGKLCIQPTSDSFSSTFSTSGWSFDSALSSLTIGKSGNTATVTISSAQSIAGPVSVYGGDIDVNQDINTTAGNASGDILLKAAGHISLADSKSVTTNGGDVVLWADTDANGGSIFVNTGASIASNGGNVTLSGGLDYTTGYAKGTSFTDWSGVRLDGSINSGAGLVLLRGEMGNIPNGQNTLSPGGVFIVPSGSITATSGNITLAGYVSSNVGTGNALRAIRLGDGIASVGQASISTTSGNISLTGTTAPTYGGAGILFDSSKIQSGSGSITLTGQRGGGEPDLLFNSGTILKNISNQISSTTGNITMNANSLEVWGEGDLYSRLPISSAGQLTIQPRTAGTTIGLSGGTGSLSLPASLFSTSFNNGFSSITIGHSTAGNITVGGALSYNDPLTLKTPGGIVVNANASISGTTSQNAHLVLWADADGNNGGVIIVNSGSSIATNGGHFWMGGGSGSTTWNGLTVGDGYATGVDATGVRDGVLINNATINTSGGDIALYGKSAVSANIEAGIRLNDHLSGSASTVVNSGAGKILLDGIGRGSAGFAGVEFNTTNTAATVRITSTNTTAEAITINGDSQAATASGWGLLFYFGTEISATGSGGGITIIGKINNLGGKAIGFHSPGQTGTRVLANGGPIIFNAITNGTGNSIYAVGNNMVVGQLAGSTVPTSSSNITLNIDHPMTGTSTNVPDLTFSSSGSLAIQPLTANTTIGIGGATGTVPLPASLFTTSFANGFSQITIGGSTQSGNINLNSVTFRDNMHLQTTGTVGVNAGQTITATGIKLQIDNTLGMGAGSSLIR